MLINATFFVLACYALAAFALFLAQRQFIYPAPPARQTVPQGYQQAHYRTSDGLGLTAAYRPAGIGLPTVVFFHGNGDGWAGASVAMERAAAAEYGILLPEYRGYSGNPGKPDEQGLYRDGRAAVAWLEARGISSAETVLIGNSLGTGVATQLAIEKRPAALVLVSPFRSMPSIVGEKLPWLPASWLVRDKFDNEQKLPGVAAPVLILHGQDDQLIPADHSRRLQKLAQNAKLLLFASAGHELAYLPQAGDAQVAWIASEIRRDRREE